MTKNKQVDWATIERDYRAGVKTDRQIGKEHGLSHTGIQKRAQKEGWDRDLRARIHAKAEALVARRAVAKELAKERLATDKQVVEANAELQANLIRSHRADLQEGRQIVNSLLLELKAVSSAELQKALEVVLAERQAHVRSDVLQRAFDAALALSGRAGIVHKLASALVILIEKERIAFGIEKGEGSQEDAITAALRLVSGHLDTGTADAR